MTKRAELEGKTFDRLTVVKRMQSKNGKARWLCRCSCGGETITDSNHLLSGHTKSCGCLSKERIKNLNLGKCLTENLIGNTYSNLTVISFSHYSDDKKRTFWNCKCKCGEEIIVRADQLKSGHTTSCGCLYYYQLKKLPNYCEDMKRIFHIWQGMRTRCFCVSDTSYKNYGGRGITVCEEWINDPISFINWSLENGYKKELTIDRVNNDGNYEPSNCRWATRIEQANNTRRNIYIEFHGETKSLADWSRLLGFDYSKVLRLLRKGIQFEKAIMY